MGEFEGIQCTNIRFHDNQKMMGMVPQKSTGITVKRCQIKTPRIPKQEAPRYNYNSRM